MIDDNPELEEHYESTPIMPSGLGRPPKYDTPEQLYEKCKQYFETCNPKPLTYTDDDGVHVEQIRTALL